MTDREKAIVMAYTGITMLKGDKFKIFHAYVEELFGREVYTHEFLSLHDEIKERSKADFLKLCEETEFVNAYSDDGVTVADDVLDKIRAEIVGKYRVILEGTPKDDWAVRWNDCVDEILQIIDKYKAESEDRE